MAGYTKSYYNAAMIRLVALVVLAPSVSLAVEVTPSPDGDFLTAWAVAGPVAPSRGAALLAAGEPRGAPWRALFAPSKTVDAGKDRRPKKGLETWFGLVLVADAPLVADLKLGSDGVADVFLDGKPISHYERPYGALWDDHVVPLRVEGGRHALLLRTTRKADQLGGRWRIVCRIHDRQGQVPKGLHVELPEVTDVPSANADAATLSVKRTLLKNGYRLAVELRRTGAFVRPQAVPWTASVSGRAVASGAIGDPAKTVDVALDAGGPATLTITAGGRTWVEKLPYRKAWHEALAAAEADFAAVDTSRFPEGTVASLEYNLQRVRGHVLEGIPDTTWLDGEVQKVAGWMKTFRAGTDPLATWRGAFYRAYRSPFDGRLQGYSVHIPKSAFESKTPRPLVVGLHGIGSGTHYTLRRVLGKDVEPPGRHATKTDIRGDMPVLPDYGVITATAWGYHNSAFWFYGEDDVMRVASEMKKAYPIDPDRVYLTGLSLGGLGTYHVGSHYPDQFAGLGPLGGFSSVKLYQQIRKWPKADWEKVVIEQRDATSYAENGLHTPMRVVHGRLDGPEQARAMVDKYKKLGYRVELETPELGHDVWQYAYGEGKLVRWLKQFRRPAAPDDIVFKTQCYRYVHAYWATLGWIDDYTRPALLRLHVDAPKRSRIAIDEATNLRGFSLDLAKPKLAAGPVQIAIAGQTLTATEHGAIHLRREGNGPWALAASVEPPAGWKRPGVSGPLDDIMNAPHVFVVGTRDPAQTDVNRRLVAEDRRYLRHVQHQVSFPVVDDAALTSADLAGKDLVLYGNPSSNAVLKRILDTGKVPLRFEPNAIVLGGKRYEGEDVAIEMIFPNPLAPGHVFKVVAGVTWQGTLLSRFLPRFVPDVIVYDRRMATRYGERILIDRPTLFAGFFKSDWTL